MFKPSTDYALVNKDHTVVAKGSAKKMRKLRKELRDGHRVYVSYNSMVGDTVK